MYVNYVGLCFWGSSLRKTGCFNKYQLLAIAISTCIYQFIVRSYHNVIFPLYLNNVKRMLLFYKQCLLKNS